MNNKKETEKLSPPGLIASLASGFNAVTNNIKIIIIPVLVDLLLWFGPQMGLKSLSGSQTYSVRYPVRSLLANKT